MPEQTEQTKQPDQTPVPVPEAVTGPLAAWGQQRYDAGYTAGQAAGAEKALADHMQAAHPPAPAPAPAPSPWTPLRRHDLTRDEGWTIGTGPRPTVQASINKRETVAFTPAGLVLTAKRVGNEIHSCDITSRHAPLPTHFAVELDLAFSGDPLGPGLFPAPLWTKTLDGSGGELDGWEAIGAYWTATGKTERSMRHKMTAIALPATSPLLQWQRPLAPTLDSLDLTVTRTYRWEKTPGAFAMLLDGRTIAVITRADVDGPGPLVAGKPLPLWAAKPGRWDTQFEAGQWYTRHTWQVGSRTTPGFDNAGPLPTTWRESRMHISRLQTWTYTP